MVLQRNWVLYAGFVFTCLEDRSWSLFSAIVLQTIGGMRFVSLGQFSESFLQMILSGSLGGIIDRISRKNAIILTISFNNFSMLAAIVLMMISQSLSSTDLNMICLYSAIFFCSLHRLFLNAEKSIISRDWIVILGDASTLSRENATLTSLDQLLNIIAPIAVGALATAFGVFHTLLFFGIFCILSLISKSILLSLVFKSLTYKRQSLDCSESRTSSEFSLPTSTPSKSSKSSGVLATYFQQKTFLAALGMALFYKTVMGFDNLAVGYATNASDLSIFTIGVLKSYGSVAGMAGAVSYAFMETRIGVIKAGIIGLIVQQICSMVAVASIWMPGSPMDLTGYFGFGHGAGKSDLSMSSSDYSIPVFLLAIATARYGLWCLDLAVTHSMQLHVPESERNTVFGVHMALCQAFSVPKEFLVIMLPEPSVFVFYILISYFCVTIGQILYFWYARRVWREQ